MPGYTETEVDHASMDDGGREHINNIRILKRVETPDDLIGLAMFLSSPASSFITGQSIACCGGEVMLKSGFIRASLTLFRAKLWRTILV